MENMGLTDEDKRWVLSQLANVPDKNWILAQLEEVHTKIERVETSLLTEFHKWASPRPGATTECATYPG